LFVIVDVEKLMARFPHRYVTAIVVFLALSSGRPIAAQETAGEIASRQDTGQTATDDDRKAWLLTLAGLAGAGAANLWINPERCRWCDRDAQGNDTLNGFDRSVRSALRWSDPHVHAADVLSYVTEYAPLSLLLVHREDGMAVRALVALEALAVTSLVTEGIKVSAARERPDAHFGEAGSAAAAARDANESFVSGHASGTVALVAAMVRSCRAQHCSYEKPLWLIGGPLALSSMWLRIAADKHYMTDALSGAGLGAAVGWWLPASHRRIAHEPSILPAIAPHSAQLTVAYDW
jgi:membrane-associated phospholipid phosphatase